MKYKKCRKCKEQKTIDNFFSSGHKTKDGKDPVLAIKGKQLSDAFGIDSDGIIEHIPVKTNGKTMVIAR